jgi:hypothetical protein
MDQYGKEVTVQANLLLDQYDHLQTTSYFQLNLSQEEIVDENQ